MHIPDNCQPGILCHKSPSLRRWFNFQNMSNYSINKQKGYVSIYRSAFEHWICESEPYCKGLAWMHIISAVNYKPANVFVQGELLACGVGQSVRSLESWAKAWSWGEGSSGKSKVRRFLKLLEKEGAISIESLGKTTRITVLNYEEYQGHSNRTRPPTSRRKSIDGESLLQRSCNAPEIEMKSNNNLNKDNISNNENKGEGEPSQIDIHLDDVIQLRIKKALSDGKAEARWELEYPGLLIHKEAEKCARYYVKKLLDKKGATLLKIQQEIEEAPSERYILELTNWLDKAQNFNNEKKSNSRQKTARKSRAQRINERRS